LLNIVRIFFNTRIPRTMKLRVLGTMNLNSIQRCIKKAIQRRRSVNTKFPPRNPHDGCQLNGKQIFFIKLLTKKLFPL